MQNLKSIIPLLLSFILILLIPTITYGQQIQGYVKDQKTGEALTGVNVFIDGTTTGTITDTKGFYSLKTENFPIVLTFSYIGYESRKVSLKQAPQNKINVNLSTITSQLPEAIVRAKPKIDTIYNEPYSVVDYEFFDKYLLILVYRGIRKRYSVLLIDEYGKELFEESLGQKAPVGFYKGCLGAVYFLTAYTAQQIYIDEEKIYFYKPVNLSVFEKASYPCILSANDYVYFENYYIKGQVIQFYRIHKDSTNGTRENFAMVMDKERVTMADSEVEFEQLADNIAEFHGAIGIGEMLSNPSFVSRVVFEPIYAPMFQLQDSLIIFNHRFHRIEFYHTPQEQFKTVEIEYSKDRKWKKQIIRDEDTQQFYILTDTRWGYIIKRIDVQTGITSDLIELDRAFVSNIKAKGGYLYFLENDFRNESFISKLQKVRIE